VSKFGLHLAWRCQAKCQAFGLAKHKQSTSQHARTLRYWNKLSSGASLMCSTFLATVAAGLAEGLWLVAGSLCAWDQE
jgi:hypothetical protein